MRVALDVAGPELAARHHREIFQAALADPLDLKRCVRSFVGSPAMPALRAEAPLTTLGPAAALQAKTGETGPGQGSSLGTRSES